MVSSTTGEMLIPSRYLLELRLSPSTPNQWTFTLDLVDMNAGAPSSSQSRGNTYLDPNGTDSNPIVDQPELEGLEVENPLALLEIMTNQPQPLSESEMITLEAKLAKKDRELKAARQELNKIKGEKTKLKQEVVSTQRNPD